MLNKDFKDKVISEIFVMIEKLKNNKGMEVAFEMAIKENFKNKLRLFQYLPLVIIESDLDTIDKFIFISSIIATHLPNTGNENFKNGTDHFVISFQKTECPRNKEVIEELLRKRRVKDVMKHIRNHMLQNEKNIDYVSMFFDLFYFNEKTKQKWAKLYFCECSKKESE